MLARQDSLCILHKTQAVQLAEWQIIGVQTLIIGSYSTLLKRAHTKSSSFLLFYLFLLQKHSQILQELDESCSKVTECSKRKKKRHKVGWPTCAVSYQEQHKHHNDSRDFVHNVLIYLHVHPSRGELQLLAGA